MKLAPGNFILAVNEKPLKTTDNYWELFNVLPGPQVRVPGEFQAFGWMARGP